MHEFSVAALPASHTCFFPHYVQHHFHIKEEYEIGEMLKERNVANKVNWIKSKDTTKVLPVQKHSTTRDTRTKRNEQKHERVFNIILGLIIKNIHSTNTEFPPYTHVFKC